eukprot:s3531_g14.t1
MDLDGGYKCRVLEFHETSLCNRTQEDILNDVDGISSAECTPEVGQRFRSSSSMKVLLAAQEHQQATQSFSESEATVQSEECFQSLALRRSEAPSAAPSAPSCHPSREGIPAAKQTVPSPRNLPSLQWLGAEDVSDLLMPSIVLCRCYKTCLHLMPVLVGHIERSAAWLQLFPASEVETDSSHERGGD